MFVLNITGTTVDYWLGLEYQAGPPAFFQWTQSGTPITSTYSAWLLGQPNLTPAEQGVQMVGSQAFQYQDTSTAIP